MTVACVVLGLLAGTGSASAHAVLISTEPGQGAVLATMPATVSLSFSEPVALAADGVRVFGPTGAQLDDRRSRQLGEARTVGVGLPDRDWEHGTYTVSWRVVSADSHPVAGAFTFSVGHPSPARSPAVAQSGTGAGVGVSYAVTRAAAFTAYALLVGSIAFVLLCWPGAITSRGVRRVILVGWAGLLATTMATLLLQGPYANGLGLDRALDSEIIAQTVAGRSGTAWSARLMLLALAGGYLVLLCAWLGQLGRRGRVWFGALGVALALGLAATWAAAGHAGVGPQAPLALLVDVVHLLAMGGWLGGLITLLVVLRPSATPQGTTPAAPARAVHRFSSIATGAIVVLIGTGGYQSWRQLGSWAAFGSTDYGRLLLVKLGVVALMLGVAAASHRWVTRQRRALIGVGAATLAVPSGTAGTVLRRSVLAETALGMLVLGVTALLVNTEPGRTATAAPRGPDHQVVSYNTGGPGGRGQLTVDLDPAGTGPNTIRILVEDSTGLRQDVAELRATLTLRSQDLGPLVIPLQRLPRQDNGPGSYQASGITLPYPGSWELRITVRTSEIDQTTVAIPVEIS